MRSFLKLLAALTAVGLTASPLKGADPTTSAIEGFRKSRGQALVRENQNFMRWLEGAVTQARMQKKTAELVRLESLLEQLRVETAELQSKGDKHTLLPTTDVQLRLFLIGTEWQPGNRKAEARIFTEDGKFKGKNHEITFNVAGKNKVFLIWSPNSQGECVFNEDYTEMRELSGVGNVWYRAP
ncbi:hypothetical protein [Verrucomicrobium sp. BvORR106]|uniref:hypothetical protein n=1 Tax=Verrucomicrobium sp. BvORR106 TaxID=1403819 RepID=UPI00056EDC77|nr:hypothetical protein [Verrucomicrobium sp. BvORR106]